MGIRLLPTALSLLLLLPFATLRAEELPDGAMTFFVNDKKPKRYAAYAGKSRARIQKKEFHSPPRGMIVRLDTSAWAGFEVAADEEPLDLGAVLEHAALEFWIKGDNHPADLSVALIDGPEDGKGIFSRLRLADYLTLKPHWQKVAIPLSHFPGVGSYWTEATGVVKESIDWSDIVAFALDTSAAQVPLEFCIDDVIIVPEYRVTEEHVAASLAALAKEIEQAKQHMRAAAERPPDYAEKVDRAFAEMSRAWASFTQARAAGKLGEVPSLARDADKRISYLRHLVYPSRQLCSDTAPSFKLSAWQTHYQPASLPTYLDNIEHFEAVCPLVYQIGADSESVPLASGVNIPHILRVSHAAGVKVLATVQNHGGETNNPEILITMISDPAKAARHAELLAENVVRDGFDGLDVDYEGMLDRDRSKGVREKFSAFVRLLAREMRARDKILSVTVHAKVSSPGHWFTLNQDWETIGEVADEVRIMCYDYWWRENSAGPHAPLGWIEKVIDLAFAKMPREKVIIGLNCHSRDWAGRSHRQLRAAEVKELQSKYRKKWGYGRELTSPYLLGRIPSFTYTEGGVDHLVWGVNTKSLVEKARMVKSKGAAGICLWALGGESPRLWDKFAKEVR